MKTYRAVEYTAEIGSIAGAAKAVGLSYKAASMAVQTMNSLSEAPLAERTVGGRACGLIKASHRILALAKEAGQRAE